MGRDIISAAGMWLVSWDNTKPELKILAVKYWSLIGEENPMGRGAAALGHLMKMAPVRLNLLPGFSLATAHPTGRSLEFIPAGAIYCSAMEVFVGKNQKPSIAMRTEPEIVTG
jgi:hypothetical protein